MKRCMQTRHAMGKCALDSVPLLEISKKTVEREVNRELKRIMGCQLSVGQEHRDRCRMAVRLAYTFGVAALVDSLNALMDMTQKTCVTEDMIKCAVASKVNRVYFFDYFPELFDDDLAPIIKDFCDHSDRIHLSSTCKYPFSSTVVFFGFHF